MLQYLARSLVENDVLETGPTLHLFYRYPRCVHSEILVKESSGRAGPKMKRPLPFLRKIGICFSVVTKIREVAQHKVHHDLRLASREPRKSFSPERVFCLRYHGAVLRH